MRRPLSLLPALLAVAAVGTLAPAAAGTQAGTQAATQAGTPAGTPAGVGTAPAARDEDQDPLQVSIARLTPSEVPERGPVQMDGTVTNVSDERWRAVNVHAFVGYAPMTTPEELVAAREVPADADVGQRILAPGTFDDLGGLDPGETATFEIRLDRDQIPVSEPGVYWFGAHALGNTTEARDGIADGRARTFLPLVSPTRDSLDAAVVVPLRRPVRHARNGRLAGEDGWADDLGPGGYLRQLEQLGTAAGNRPVTWLLDPAVPDAVERLVDGNAARSLAATPGAGPEDPDGGSPEEEASPSETSSPSPEPEEEPPPPGPAAAPGRVWLDRLDTALDDGQVLALPYGDVDVSAAQHHGSDLLREARLRSAEEMELLDLSALPAVAAPSGYLSPDALEALPAGTLAFATERMLPPDAGLGSRDVAGRHVVFTAPDIAEGGPGPDDPLGVVAIRQRILAEGAVRLLSGRRTPMVVVLPKTWAPERPRTFWSGLGVPWLSLVEAGTLEPAGELPSDALDYPPEQRAAELPAANFATAEQLVDEGQVLANVLTDNDELDREVLEEALTSLSYGGREDAEQVRLRTEASLAWLGRRAGSVRVRAPLGVTLSSATGGFATTLTNRLDHPVTISLRAIGDDSVVVDLPTSIDLAPRGRQTVVLSARASSPGVHYVRLLVTDDNGSPLGSSDMLPVRSSQVSQVIWLILGVGVGLLFLAIAVRLVRRIRNGRE